MKLRPPVAPLVVCAAAAVASISWWVGDPAIHADAEPATERPVMYVKASSPVPVGPPRSNPSVAATAPLEDKDDGLGDEELWSHISDPANSDLSPDLFKDLTQLGVDVVRADATGEGRDRWPEYWRKDASARAGACCADVAIHAAGAFKDPANPNVVSVTVIWDATGPRAGGTRVTNVTLRRTDAIWSPSRR